jgi:hypothetical protein
MCYNYSNLQNVTIICSYYLWVSNTFIHQYKPRLQVTKTLDNMMIVGIEVVSDYHEELHFLRYNAE